MRYGVVSDVHGNLEALTVVLEHLAGQKVDRYAFLGDAVGYGANPDEVCTILRSLGGVAVLGNHDAALTGRMDTEMYYDAARRALAWGRERVSAANQAWLQGLPYTVSEGDVTFSHGSPEVPEQFDYLFSAEQVEEMVARDVPLSRVTLIGHSHLTVSFEVAQGQVTALQQPVIACAPSAQYIITVGSVGQPRDRDPRACCATFDTETGRFEYHRLTYDTKATRQKILDAGLAPVFGERLLVGI